MTAGEKKKQHKALADVRGVIRGWAFTSDDTLRNYLAVGMIEVSKLPSEYRADGEDLLQPIRDRLVSLITCQN